MEIRFANSPTETASMNTAALRQHFLVEQLICKDKLKLVYSHHDRMIIGGVQPVHLTIQMPNEAELRAEYFCERREMGIINVGGDGIVEVDGHAYSLQSYDCLYIGKGSKAISMSSVSADTPAVFYLLSAPAHHAYPTTLFTKEQAAPVRLGSAVTSNARTVYKYIHREGIQSCQLVMGLTILDEGSVWNSVPPHTHTRRMEVYFYFNLPDEQRIFHFMGEGQETRHLVVANHEAVISPPWSTHFGCGTSNYGFIWGMAGENLMYTDMDPLPINTIA
jgi:4-deoxy-L-threo-5-hexosulose-uronate ketol-isomerase